MSVCPCPALIRVRCRDVKRGQARTARYSPELGESWRRSLRSPRPLSRLWFWRSLERERDRDRERDGGDGDGELERDRDRAPRPRSRSSRSRSSRSRSSRSRSSRLRFLASFRSFLRSFFSFFFSFFIRFRSFRVVSSRPSSLCPSPFRCALAASRSRRCSSFSARESFGMCSWVLDGAAPRPSTFECVEAGGVREALGFSGAAAIGPKSKQEHAPVPRPQSHAPSRP